jgi:hypothetical protein
MMNEILVMSQWYKDNNLSFSHINTFDERQYIRKMRNLFLLVVLVGIILFRTEAFLGGLRRT